MKGRRVGAVGEVRAQSAITAAKQRVWRRMGMVGIWIIGPELEHPLRYGNHVLVPHKFGITGAPRAAPQRRQGQQWGLGFKQRVKSLHWVEGAKRATPVVEMLEKEADTWMSVLGEYELPGEGWYNIDWEWLEQKLFECAKAKGVKLFTNADCEAWFAQQMEVALDKIRRGR